MKLVTFQTIDALKELINKGYLECKEIFVDTKKYGYSFTWIIEKMYELLNNEYDAKYPIWCWVKFKNGICPPKHKGKKIKGYDVKITFNKNREDVLITDYQRFSFLLNNKYIPKNKKDKENFDKLLNTNNITDEDLKAYIRKDKYNVHRTDKEFLRVCDEIRKSFDECITEKSDVLQGCVWRINLSEVEKIEILNNEDYTYGTFNYVRSNGKRYNWIEAFYKKLK